MFHATDSLVDDVALSYPRNNVAWKPDFGLAFTRVLPPMNQAAGTLPPQTDASALIASFVRIEEFSAKDMDDWHGLASQRTESAPFVDQTWMRSWIAAFAATNHVCLCVRRDGQLVGLAFMMPVRERWTRKTVEVLESTTNDWSYRYEFLALNDEDAIYRELWTTLFSQEERDVIRLSWVVDENPTMTWGLRVAKELGWPSVVVYAASSPWRTIPKTGEPWDKGLKSKFKANLRNRERRLEAAGDVRFTVVRDRDALDDAVRTFYDIEAKSWKGDEGTAVVMQDAAKNLFDGLVHGSTADIWVPILSVGARPIASQFVRVWDRTMFVLKTAYDPAFSAYSPGQLLTARVIRYGIENGMEALDFLGIAMPWKSDWVPEERRNVQLIFCSPSVTGRYAYWSRYGIKNELKKVPFTVPLVRRLRALRRPR